jgi:hypothetical protein
MAKRAEPDTVRETGHITFPKDLAKAPVLSSLSKRFAIIFNSRGSTVRSDLGLVALAVYGKIAEAIAWMQAKDTAFEAIEKNVLE